MGPRELLEAFFPFVAPTTEQRNRERSKISKLHATISANRVVFGYKALDHDDMDGPAAAWLTTHTTVND
jgi:hypothetical protein